MAWTGNVLHPVRGLNVHDLIAPEVPNRPDISPLGDLIVAQTLPESSETVRLGRSYYAINTTGQLLSQIFSTDQTQCAAVLWNSATPVKPGTAAICLVVDSISGVNVNLTDPVCTYGAIGVVFPPPRPPAYTLTGQIYPNQRPTKSLSGNDRDKSNQNAGVQQPAMGVCFSPTVSSGSPPKPFWMTFPGKTTSLNSTTNAKSTWDYYLRGLVVVPPDGLFQFSPCGTNQAGAVTTQWCLRWHEVSLVLG